MKADSVVAALIPIAFLCWMLYCEYSINRRINLLLSRHDGSPPTLEEVKEWIAEYNHWHTDRVLVVIQRVNVRLDRRLVSLALCSCGSMGFCTSGVKWSFGDRLLATIPPGSASLAEEHPKLFTALTPDAACHVYSIRTDRLIRELTAQDRAQVLSSN